MGICDVTERRYIRLIEATPEGKTVTSRHTDTGPNSGPTALADMVSDAFLDSMSTFAPLAPDTTTAVRDPNLPSVSELCVLNSLH